MYDYKNNLSGFFLVTLILIKKITMRKNIFTLTIVFISCLNLNAQFSIENGPVLEKSESGKVTKIIGGEQNAFYVLKENGRGSGQKFFIEKYNLSDLTPGFTTYLPISKKAYNIESYFTGERCLFFYCTEDKTTSSLFVCSVDTKGVPSKEIELVTINKHIQDNSVLTYPTHYFEIGSSPNKKNLTVISRSYENNGEKLKLSLTVFVLKNMVKSWQKDITLLGGKSLTIDDEGNVMFISSGEKDNMSLVYINQGGKVINKKPLDLKSNQFLEGVNIVKTNGTITVGGFFKEKNDSSYNAGIFCQIFNSVTIEKIQSEKQYLPEELKSSLFYSDEGFIGKQFYIENTKIIDNDIYFIGKDVEQDNITIIKGVNGSQAAFNGFNSNTPFVSNHNFDLNYHPNAANTYKTSKVVIFKVGASGKIDWIKDCSAGSEILNRSAGFQSSPNISLTIKVINFIMDKKLVLFHAYTSASEGWVKAVNVKYSILGKDGTLITDVLCADDNQCFLYNAKGIIGYYDVFYQYGKNVIVYFNEKNKQHFGRIVFD